MSLDHFKFQPSSEFITVCRIGIVSAGYNRELVDNLLSSVLQTLEKHGVSRQNIDTYDVPGSNEIPYLLNMLAQTEEYDCLIALGIVIAGDTQHHEMIERTTAGAIQQIGLQSEIPVINGIITTNTQEQAEARAGAKINRGAEFAVAALCMAEHKILLSERLEMIDSEEFSRHKSLENN